MRAGNPVQPFRLAGTPNLPDERKRGRVPVPTRLVWSTPRGFTSEQLAAAFDPPPGPEPPPAHVPLSTGETTRRPAYCRSGAKAILAADPGVDRSAQFMQAIPYAAMSGMTPERFDAIAREHSRGCAGKYLEGRD
jgi:hypothetical protein